MAESLGINFKTDKMGLGDDLPDANFIESIKERKKRWLPKNKEFIKDSYLEKYKLPLYNKICTQLFKTMVINPDGEVFPCCYVTNKKNSFGNILKQPFKKIWNNQKYQYSRSLFVRAFRKPKKVRTICSDCNNFRKIE